MNLINNYLYSYALPWGTSLASPYVCNFSEDQVWYNLLANQLCLSTEKKDNVGWYKDKNWETQLRARPYECGMIVSNEKLKLGIFEFEFILPSFRGSWPAIWLLDINKQPNILPEIDIMEQFVKNCWWKHKLSINYQDGPIYEDNLTIGKSVRKCKLWYKEPIRLVFEWSIFRMCWIINDELVFTVEAKNVKNFPITPMNLIINSGVGDWKPSGTLDPFIITKAEYTKL